jgi:hypothetical protein
MPLQDDGPPTAADHSHEDKIAHECAPVVCSLNDGAVGFRGEEHATDTEGVCEASDDFWPTPSVPAWRPQGTVSTITAEIAEAGDQQLGDAPHRSAHSDVWDQHQDPASAQTSATALAGGVDLVS